MRRVKTSQNPNDAVATVEHDDDSASSDANEAAVNQLNAPPPNTPDERPAGAPASPPPDDPTTDGTGAAAMPSVPGGAPGITPPPDEHHAIPPAPLDTSDHPQTRRWRVTNFEGRRVALAGGVVNLVKGKIVDDANYDIATLIAAGVDLEPLEG